MTYRTILSQFLLTLGSLRSAVQLIRERELWRGINAYSWVFKALMIVAILIGLTFLGEVGSWLGDLVSGNAEVDMFGSMGIMASSLATEGYESFSSGLLKYVILVLAEVVVFHFMQRALEEIQGHPIRTDFQAFFAAQIRMVKVALRSWILELLISILVSIVFGIFGFLEWLEPGVLFLVQCYFFGLVVLDNYNEQFGMTIKESMLFSRAYLGVSLALGLVLYLMMLIPFLGVVAGTILVSVTAAIVMHQVAGLSVEESQLAEEG